MGTTSEKLTYLNTTKTLIKDNLNLGGANISTEPFRAYSSKLKGIYKDFLANGTDTLWNNWEKVSGSGTTLSLTPTIKGKMKVDLKGNTYQYSDENLFNKTARQGNTANTTTTNRIYFDNIIYVKQGESYILSTDLDTSVFRYAINININPTPRTGSADWDTGWKTTSSITFTAPINGYIGVPVSRINDSSIAPNDITNVHWELKKSAPSPDYPQDIQVVSGDNTIKVEGKNLFDISKITAFYNASYTAPSTAGTISNGIITSNFGFAGDKRFIYDSAMKLDAGTYTLSAYVKANKSSGDKQARLGIYKKSGTTYINGKTTTLANYNEEERLSLTFTLEEQTEIIIQLQSVGGGGVYNDLNIQFRNVQLEKCNQATTYTPYVSQTYPITLPTGTFMGAIGTYKDGIFKAEDGDKYYDTLDSATKQTLTYGKWYLNKQIGKVVLDGTQSITLSNWRATASSVGWIYPYSIINSITSSSTGTTPQIICNKLIPANIDDLYNGAVNNGIGLWQNTSYGIVVRTSDTTLTTVSLINTYLSNNPMSVYVPLATPTYEEITDTTLLSQLEAIKYSYNEQTNISQVNDDMPFILDVVALKEMS